ncbi:MAG: aminomethyl-transferring glycine dehydrogenase [Acidimicrobiia bacterium]|nr:aminomethyl-transferring glycine dehydrogenase [Acidimicrobiia bacterium]MDX2468476.1 aminomethyl-transferring glycine dehydrogenase [Acidimicrobiia bacterium]
MSRADTGAANFADRHIGPTDDDIDAMLAVVGLESLEDLKAKVVPESIRVRDDFDLPEADSEPEVLARLKRLGDANSIYTSLIGMGYYGTHTPSVILRNVLENPGWYTSYTPYQPEISQGRLEAMLNYQTMVSDLTGMDIANASLLDEATAVAEAMTMLRRASRSKANTFFVDAECHPQVIQVVQTRAVPLGIDVVVGDPAAIDTAQVYGVVLQYPGTTGIVRDDRQLIASLKEAGVLVAVATDLLALTLLTPPGEMDVDVAVGSSQRFGVPMMFGGPHAAFMATKDKFKRSMPGRLVGVSKDTKNRMALRLALTTREQHIRREKATSNICTAQALLAVMAGMYAVWHGPEGLAAIAEELHRLTSALAAQLAAGGLELVNDTWFDTLTVKTPGRAEEVVAAAEDRMINLRLIDQDHVGVSLDETSTEEVVAAVSESFFVSGVAGTVGDGLPAGLRRTSQFLAHDVFHSYRSETEMMRYMRKLQGRDIALDRSMIPLGSCTMKLNAATEMAAVTWPEFASLHPYVPLDQAGGYLEMIADLERWLATATGYDAVSLQPNAGSQGEYSGLLAINAYHESRDEGHRNICLIPASAHGTNPASAVMAGLSVVVVATDGSGNIDLADLKEKANQHSANLAALMITYPSTHGVFEESVREVCDMVHEHGGQVYIDGANLNALLGLAKPGEFGGDVSHLNLHKTFAIPHGGGGPGVGPIGVKAHLEPFLPGHPLVNDQKGFRDGVGAVSAAPWGSAGVLPISWSYIALMGGDGLAKATEVAILSANYIATKLADHYPVLYTGSSGLVAHECILDLRDIKHDVGVSADDFAKRLIDYGFHAPTMSFPVPGTLMIEPTESESLAELDRFVEAMIAIKAEVDDIGAGEVPLEDSPLHNAPHTAEDVVGDEWSHPYGREQAAFPVPGLRHDKYWPPVGRIDGAYGDRNVVCACPPMDVYTDGIVD